ncbi:hypothetical protein LX87_05574 [Larkinella arboricola]|uniref:Uncharacterized protein n=1 Tax=Larkinella arboricola TaxID=643671 RepID=A0A327WJA4_LARAB|nr:hypothetical protein [Larkinella arboricola]RAJ90008.1 hypothetical protein LX87_05574 [Larkinella arboricola]
MQTKIDFFLTRDFWFPGRWLGAISMSIAPLLLLMAELLRVQFDFFFTQQLIAFDQQPTRLLTVYSLFLAGNILLWPAVLTLTNLVEQKAPAWALWGGSFVLLGLFARTFHYGVNHLAFQLVKVHRPGLSGTRTPLAVMPVRMPSIFVYRMPTGVALSFPKGCPTKPLCLRRMPSQQALWLRI